MKHKFKIGDKVYFTAAYSTKACNRFNYPEGNLIPLAKKEGFVVGTRVTIMANYKFTPAKISRGYYDADNDFKPAYSTGDREHVLLVTDKMHTKPFLVRFKDLFDKVPQ